MLTGCGEILKSYISSHFGVKVRSVELNVNQRCSGMIVSATDIEEASLAGAFGVMAALEGETGKMAAFKRLSDSPYQMSCELTDVNQVCNREKTFPSEWITDHGTGIGPEFLDYALPLIQGEPERVMENGLPVYCFRK